MRAVVLATVVGLLLAGAYWGAPDVIRDPYSPLEAYQQSLTPQRDALGGPAARAESPPALTGALGRAIGEIVGRAEGTYGVLIRVVESGQEVAINGDRPFMAASCYKIPLALYLYELAAADAICLEETIQHREDHYVDGAGILQGREPGEHYSLRYLAKLSLRDSDNIAASMLLERLGMEEFKRYQRGLGATSVPPDENLASPRDVARFLEVLLILHSRHEENYTDILEALETAYPRDRIPAGVPASLKVASKTGTWPGTINDAAILFYSHATIILVVMSEGVPSYGAGSSVIARIASVLHDKLSH